jgi:glyoxylase-like metal-dependent hydrolase (beta-lactamase superfamily II)
VVNFAFKGDRMKKLQQIGFWLFVLVMASFLFIQANNTGRKIPRTPFPAGVATAQSWDEVLAHPQDIAVTTYETGKISTNKSGLVNFKDSRARGLQDKALLIPVKVYLLKHPTRGYLLIDAGFDQTYAHQPHGSMKGIGAAFFPKSQQTEGQAIGQVLAKQNIVPAMAFFTHLHFDHLSGVLDLPLERMTLVVGRGEPYLNIRHVVYGDFLAQARGLQEIDFSQAKSLPPFGPAVDVFGDNSLWALATPGHTVGHVSYLVNAQSGAELITGDACNLKEELKTGIGPGWFSTDVKQAQASFDEIKAFHKKYPQVKIQCGHEL